MYRILRSYYQFNPRLLVRLYKKHVNSSTEDIGIAVMGCSVSVRNDVDLPRKDSRVATGTDGNQ